MVSWGGGTTDIGNGGTGGLSVSNVFLRLPEPNDGFDELWRRLRNPLDLAEGEATGDETVGVDISGGIEGGCASGPGIMTFKAGGEAGTTVGTECNAGEAGVVGANSLASESPS